MKVSSACLVLLAAAAGVFGFAEREEIHHPGADSDGEGIVLTPQNNYNGWVNPEDLPPMPQCISLWYQPSWLSIMTKCTSKQCTRHFGVFCTHHQWLTGLDCLSVEFSSDVVAGYLPYCSRSILAKAQLYRWIRNVTGRTWLVDFGDANGLQNLSPASLTKGYTDIDVIDHAPPCLINSVPASSNEPFRHITGSCGFTSTTEHTGNAARPWEYSERQRSIISLDSETVGYNFTGRRIPNGEYFDKECFCGTFNIDTKTEPCHGKGKLDLTKERLWMNATCGPTSLPDNWTEALKTTEFAYIPIEDWHWPTLVTDMPKQLSELTSQCSTDACQTDSSGYCKVIRAVDRACFCQDISYDSCQGPCRIFETRIEYVNWLHGLCSNVPDWHGLPDNWRQLAALTVFDIIPWQWKVKQSNTYMASIIPLGSAKPTEACSSTGLKLASIALVNIAPFIAIYFGRGKGKNPTLRGFLWRAHPRRWFLTGTSIAALQLVGNLFNAFLVQQTVGYEDVPAIQLMLLWCTMPRLTWITTLLAVLQPSETINLSVAASFLVAEMILQVFSSVYMIMTINYGLEHDFYHGAMARLNSNVSAQFMYAGALLWLIVNVVAVVLSLEAISRWRRNKQTKSNIVKELMALFNDICTWIEERSTQDGTYKSRESEEAQLRSSEGPTQAGYGTFRPDEGLDNKAIHKAPVELYAAAVTGILLLLWIAQWSFWGGYINLSLEGFCPPNLWVLSVVFIAFSLAGAPVWGKL